MMEGCERDRVDSPRSERQSGAGRENKMFSLKSVEPGEGESLRHCLLVIRLWRSKAQREQGEKEGFTGAVTELSFRNYEKESEKIEGKRVMGTRRRGGVSRVCK